MLKMVLAIMFFCLTGSLAAQYECTVKNFTTENGLPQNTVTAMALDYSGYLWIGTQSGLVRYDGAAFTTFVFDKKNSDPASNNVQSIMNIPGEQKIFIRLRNGLVYTIVNGVPVLYSDSVRNTIYYYNVYNYFPSASLFNKFNLTIETLSKRNNWNANNLLLLPVNTRDFMVASANPRSLYYYKNGIKEKEIPVGPGLRRVIIAGKYRFMADDAAGLYLFDTITAQFNKVEVNWRTIGPALYDRKEIVYYNDEYSGECYCSCKSDFYQIRFDPVNRMVKFMPLFSIKDQSHFWTNIIYDSLNAVFFLSTLNEGLFQVKLKKIQTFNLNKNLPKGLSPGSVINYSVLKNGDSSVVIPSGFELSSGGSATGIKKTGNIFGNRETIGLSHDGSIFCAEDSLLFYYSPVDGFVHKYVFSEAFNRTNNSYIRMIYPEGDSVWISTNQGIYCLTKQKSTKIFSRARDNQTIYFGLCLFYRISADQALISNNMGLFRIKTSPPYSIDTLNSMWGKQVRHISAYRDQLILSVYKHGLFVMKNNDFYKVPEDTMRPEMNFCHSTFIDGRENIWVTTDRGLYKSSAAAIVESALKPGNISFFFYYGKADGIDNTEFNGSGTPAYAVLNNGQIFYPSMGGIVTFRPEDLNDKIINSSFTINKLSADNNETDIVNDSIHLPADQDYLALQLAVPNFGEPKNLSLEYSFDSRAWVQMPVSARQLITLVHIIAGWHTLLIRKRVGFGNKDYVYKTLSIEKQKHLYEQAWFDLLIVLLFILLAWVFSEFRNRRHINRKLQLQSLVDKQTAELSRNVEIKDLLINVITHDMVTPLKYIGFISKVLRKGIEPDPQKVNQSLDEIQSSSEKILSGSTNIIKWMKYINNAISLNKESIRLYTLIDEVLEIYIPVAKNKNIQISNEVDPSVFVFADAAIFSAVLNNIIANSIKFSTSGAIRIILDKAGSGTPTVLKIIDTGSGMNEDALYVVQQVLKGDLKVIKITDKINTGLGYLMISELVKIHGLNLEVESEWSKGTTVTITIA